jgi:site-specific recombinase XerD
MNTDQLLAYWEQWMQVEDLTERTIQDRLGFIRQLERAIGTPVTEATRSQLIGFMANSEWANTTKTHYRSTLHTFFTWMQDESIRADNPAAKLPKIKTRPRVPNPFTVDEIQDVLESGIYRRTRAMVALHYYLGLRVSEIARVHGRDIDRKNRTITTLGKGEKLRRLPLNSAMWEIAEQMPRDGYWFPNQRANAVYAAGEGHILGNSVSGILSRALKRSGFVGHRGHDLRASTATLQSRAGVDPFIVKENMRHESMDTTAIYRLVSIDEQRDGFEALPKLVMPRKSARRSTRIAA